MNNIGRSVYKSKAHKNKKEYGISFKIPLTFTFAMVILLLLTTSPITSLRQLIRHAEAASLTSVNIVPSNNIVNTRTTYDIIFRTATTATIKTIEMNFPSSFDVRFTFGPNPKLIYKSGIGYGSLSNGGPSDSSTKLVYTVNSTVSISAGTRIRLEIGRIDNSEQTISNSHRVSITTKNTGGNTIDGPTSSASFFMKAIEGRDIDPYLMNRKTLLDNTAGHARGWNPNGVTTDFTITDHDVQIDEEAQDQTFVTLMLRDSHSSKAICMVNHTDFEHFLMNCTAAPPNDAELHYEIHKLPANRITSTSASFQNGKTISEASPFSPSMP
jgi:hypothetical protein